MAMVDSKGNTHRNPYKRPLRNSIGDSLIASTTSDYQETFEETKTVESKTESGTITTNATNETKYVKPIEPNYHTGYVFIVEDRLVVASSIANAIELYCEYTNRYEKDITNIRRISNEKTCISSYEAIIEG